jgi:hypothetical protein
MHKNATKCNKTLSKWCKNKHGASKIIDMFETYQPAAPLCYSSAGLGSSNYSLRASSASTLFDCGLRSLDYSLRASSASTLFECGFWSLESHLLAISAFILFGYGPLSFESLFCAINASNFPKYGSNTPVRMPYVKYEDKSTVSNTRWPGIRIKRALPRQFPCLQHEDMHRWTHRVPCNYWASTR